MSGEVGGDKLAPRVLRASRRHWAKVGAGAVGFTIVSALLVNGRPVLWSGIVFFGACSAIAMLQLIKPGTLSITSTALTVRKLGRVSTYELAVCGEFEVWRNPMGGNRLVVFEYPGVSGQLARANRRLAGASAALPDTYGLHADELAEQLNAVRESCLAGRASQT